MQSGIKSGNLRECIYLDAEYHDQQKPDWKLYPGIGWINYMIYYVKITGKKSREQKKGNPDTGRLSEIAFKGFKKHFVYVGFGSILQLKHHMVHCRDGGTDGHNRNTADNNSQSIP